MIWVDTSDEGRPVAIYSSATGSFEPVGFDRFEQLEDRSYLLLEPPLPYLVADKEPDLGDVLPGGNWAILLGEGFVLFEREGGGFEQIGFAPGTVYDGGELPGYWTIVEEDQPDNPTVETSEDSLVISHDGNPDDSCRVSIETDDFVTFGDADSATVDWEMTDGGGASPRASFGAVYGDKFGQVDVESIDGTFGRQTTTLDLSDPEEDDEFGYLQVSASDANSGSPSNITLEVYGVWME